MENGVSRTELNIKKVLSGLLIAFIVFTNGYQLLIGNLNLAVIAGSVYVVVKAMGVIREKHS